MFNKCESLKELDISNFNIKNVKDMNNMFDGCASLTKLNFGKLGFENDINMKGMFNNCSDELKIAIQKQYINIKQEAFE